MSKEKSPKKDDKKAPKISMKEKRAKKMDKKKEKDCKY